MEGEGIIKLSKSSVSRYEIEAVTDVMQKEYLGMGLQVKEFEDAIGTYLRTQKPIVCVNSGTAALHLALQSLDIKCGDEVLVPTITYVASFQAITAVGATPIACDVDEESFVIDLHDAKRRVSPNTKAIMPVWYAGDISRREKVYLFAKSMGIRVIEDAAHAFGSEINGEVFGSEGDIICFSFDGIKNITCGEGGAIIFSKEFEAEAARNARLLGVDGDSKKREKGLRSWSFSVNMQGWRYHMSNINASIGIAQLKRIDEFKIKKKLLLNAYINELKKIPGCEIPKFDFEGVFMHIFVILVSENLRDQLRKFLLSRGIESGIHYPPNHKLSFFKTNYILPNAERFAKKCISLPYHVDLSERDIKKISKELRNFFNERNDESQTY